MTERESLATLIHAAHRRWCLLSKVCPESLAIADAVLITGPWGTGTEPIVQDHTNGSGA